MGTERGELDNRTLTRFLDTVIEHLPAMVFIKDAEDLRFERFNRAGEELLGMKRDELVGKTDADFFPAEQAAFFQAKDREVLLGGTVLDIPEEPIATPRGTRWLHTRKIPIFDDEGRPRHLLGISMDITERRAAEEVLRSAQAELERRVAAATAELRATEEQLRHAQKMEAVGRLAGGVAHDFNNLLSVVLGYSSMLLEDLDPSHPHHVAVAEIERAGERAAELTRQLLAFSRQQVLDPKIVDLNEVLASVDRLVRRLVGEDVEVVVRPGADLGLVRVDVGQIEQVVVNLVVNARDAMPAGGRLTIETGNVALDDAYASEHPGILAGPHVMVAISDTGTGMDRATQGRVFEPFFTTKPKGKGTGLGLSTVFGIVKQSGGSIWLYSEPDRGTTFKVYFPLSSDGGEQAAERAATAPARGGAETVLLVEDEPQVRQLTRNILAKHGYVVLEAADPAAAIALCAGDAQPIDLLLTDVVMPLMSGRQLAERLVAQRPALKVLYMSGYTDNTVVHHGVLDAGIWFLQKPITPDALAAKVREVLDA
jgi:PAS domain S-box-containing protein